MRKLFLSIIIILLFSQLLFADTNNNSIAGIVWTKIDGSKTGGSVLDLGEPCNFDDNTLYEPSVIKDGGIYKMWYTGSKHPVVRIGYAESENGIDWIKVPGTCTGGSVLDVGESGNFDERGVVSATVIKVNNEYKMYYTGYNYSDLEGSGIGYAVSTDGINWEKIPGNEVNGSIINIGAPGDFDCSGIRGPDVIKDGTTYRMWYWGFDGTMNRIGYAVSENGIDWQKVPGQCTGGSVLDSGESGSFDSNGMRSPSVIKYGTIYKMWYQGSDGLIGLIGYAESLDGINWTKIPGYETGGSVLERGASGKFDDSKVWAPSVLIDGTKYRMWYTGYRDTSGDHLIGYAESIISPLNAIPGTSIDENSMLKLDASLSIAPEHMTYSWQIKDEPTPRIGKIVSVLDLAVGNYEVTLTVSDGIESDSATMIFGVPKNYPYSIPIAEAGDNQSIIEINSIVQLDGTKSWDPEGNPITYKWHFISKPAGSNATFSNYNLPTPSFIADVYGEYYISLVVKNALTESEPDQVIVSFNNIKPIANAGNNKSCIIGDIIQLDGSESEDANGDSLFYNWQIITSPEGSNAVLSNSNSITTSIQPDIKGEYIISLIVNDGILNSDPDTVSIVSISQQDVITQKLQQAIQIINGLDKSCFKNKNMVKVLTEKINESILKVSNNEYSNAYNKLKHDVIGKMDGAANTGSPDNNDWIIDNNAQNQVYPLILDAINLLEDLF